MYPGPACCHLAHTDENEVGRISTKGDCSMFKGKSRCVGLRNTSPPSSAFAAMQCFLFFGFYVGPPILDSEEKRGKISENAPKFARIAEILAGHVTRIPCIANRYRITPGPDSPLEPEVHVCLDKIVHISNESSMLKLTADVDGNVSRNAIPAPTSPQVPPSTSSNSSCVALSMGINYHWEFDDLMLSLGCRVWSFDPTVKTSVNQGCSPKDSFCTVRHPSRHQFVPVAIGVRDDVAVAANQLEDVGSRTKLHLSTDGKYREISLRTAMDHVAHIDFVDVLRLDVEGSEIPILEQWLSDGLFTKTGQLLIEIHIDDSRSTRTYERFARVLLDGVLQTMDVFYVSKNGHGTGNYELGFMARK